MVERDYFTDFTERTARTEEGQTVMTVLLPFNSQEEYRVREGSIYKEAEDSLWSLRRLEGIYQLSNLRLVTRDPEQFMDYGLFHNRFEHSLQTAIYMGQILTNNGFPDSDVTKGKVGGLTHDVATPPKGDATKKIDQENLHEEDHWREMVEDKNSLEFLRRHAVSRNELDDIIHNRGVLGEVLDVADKIAYTTFDAYQIGNYQMAHPDHPIPRGVTDEEREMFESFKKSQDMGDLVHYVTVNSDTADISFNNPELLIKLLHNRAFLSKNIYYHPYNQARDLFFGDLLRPLYSPYESDREHALTPSQLRTMTDVELVEELDSFWEPPTHFGDPRFMLRNFHPESITTCLREEAEQIADEIQEDTDLIYMGINTTPSIRSCTDWKVPDPQKPEQIIPLYKAYPDAAAAIQRTVDTIPKYSVAYYQKGNEEFDTVVERVYPEKNVR